MALACPGKPSLLLDSHRTPIIPSSSCPRTAVLTALHEASTSVGTLASLVWAAMLGLQCWLGHRASDGSDASDCWRVWSWWQVLGGILYQTLYVLLDFFFFPEGMWARWVIAAVILIVWVGTSLWPKLRGWRQERKPWAFVCYITQKTHVLLKPLFGSCTCLHVTKRVLTYTRKFSDPEYFNS